MVAFLIAALLAAGTEKPKVIVMDFTTAGGADPQVAQVLAEAVATEVSKRGFFDPVSSKDVQTLLGLERQRQMVGCSEESTCLTELAGALGARFVLSGSLSKLGDAFQLNIQMLDSQKAQPVGRSTRIANGLQILREQLPYAVAEASGTPLPPPPSRVLPYSLMGGGALFVVGGAVLAINAFSREQVLNNELNPGAGQNAPALRTQAYYQSELTDIRRTQIFAAVAVAAGAGLIGAGIAVNPPGVISQSLGPVTLVPSPQGFALVGTTR